MKSSTQVFPFIGLLGFLVQDMFTAKLAKFLHFQLGCLGLLVARRHVIALIAFRAGERDIVPH